MPTTIRKALISEFGDVDKVNIVTAEIADPAPDEVQVSVIYSGFSGADVNMRKGVYPMQRKAPLTPGYCFVGRVKRNGTGSSRFTPGDLVVCLSVYDAEAQLANMPEKYLIGVPAGLDLKTATALVLDYTTAYGMVMQAGKVTKGQNVFVHGMSGAVGFALMTLCQLQGATVYGTCSERNHAAIRDKGGVPFVYSNTKWMDEMKQLGGANAVFDALGFESWDQSWNILSPTGILIGYGGNLPSLLGQPPRSVIGPTAKLIIRGMMPMCSKKTNFYYISRDQKTFEPNLKALFDLCGQGSIQVPIKRVFDLENIQDAHRNWSSGSGFGSVLIKIADEPCL